MLKTALRAIGAQTAKRNALLYTSSLFRIPRGVRPMAPEEEEPILEQQHQPPPPPIRPSMDYTRKNAQLLPAVEAPADMDDFRITRRSPERRNRQPQPKRRFRDDDFDEEEEDSDFEPEDRRRSFSTESRRPPPPRRQHERDDAQLRPTMQSRERFMNYVHLLGRVASEPKLLAGKYVGFTLFTSDHRINNREETENKQFHWIFLRKPQHIQLAGNLLTKNARISVFGSISYIPIPDSRAKKTSITVDDLFVLESKVRGTDRRSAAAAPTRDEGLSDSDDEVASRPSPGFRPRSPPKEDYLYDSDDDADKF